jgi:hypothetical protein
MFLDSNEANNVWTAAKGVIEKDLILDGYLGTYSNAQSLNNFFRRKQLVLRFQLPYILCGTNREDLLSLKAVEIQFNESNWFHMIIGNTQNTIR